MSYQIFYKAMCAKTQDGKYAFFTQDGANNCWHYNWKGNWERDRSWVFRGVFDDADDICDKLQLIKYENEGCVKASRGKIINMMKRAAKRATTAEKIMECQPKAWWYEKERRLGKDIESFDELVDIDKNKSVYLYAYSADLLHQELN